MSSIHIERHRDISTLKQAVPPKLSLLLKISVIRDGKPTKLSMTINQIKARYWCR